jgi:serine acetyltransferase
MFDRLISYLDSVHARDPAPRSRWEIMLYPGVWALGFHRVAHWLFVGELYFLARFVNHFSRWLTAIDIHPGAKMAFDIPTGTQVFFGGEENHDGAAVRYGNTVGCY